MTAATRQQTLNMRDQASRHSLLFAAMQLSTMGRHGHPLVPSSGQGMVQTEPLILWLSPCRT